MDEEGGITGSKEEREGDWEERRQSVAQELIFPECILSANGFPVYEVSPIITFI